MFMQLQRCGVHPTISGNSEGSNYRVHCARALGRLRSAIDCRRPVRRRKHILGIKTRAFVFDQPALGSIANFTRPHGYRYCEILLHLFVGVVCIRMRPESTTVVFCRFGKAEMLSQTKRWSWLGKYGRCVHEMATIWQVRSAHPIDQSVRLLKIGVSFSAFSVCSSHHNHCFGPVLVWWDWKISNSRALKRTHGSGAFWCLAHTAL